MSYPLDGDEWMHQPEPQRTAVVLQQRTRAQQQAWLDEQYLKKRMTREQWRFQFDILSFQNADGTFPEIEV